MRMVEFKPIEATDGTVTAYLHSPIMEMEPRREKFPSVVICPGGAYVFVSKREYDPVALEYLSAGYNVFVLTYSVGSSAKNFTPLKELSQTVMTIRKNSEIWNCDPEKIAVCGFSAGGHLAASLGIMWDNKDFKSCFDTEGGLNRPNGVILSYPVITANEFAHVESIENVSGAKKGTDAYNFFSLENHVDEKTVPTFVWHTVTDEGVPVENTLQLISALQKHHISYECHLFPTGVHGISVCTEETGTADKHNNQWVQLSKNWLNKLFDYKL